MLAFCFFTRTVENDVQSLHKFLLQLILNNLGLYTLSLILLALIMAIPEFKWKIIIIKLLIILQSILIIQK